MKIQSSVRNIVSIALLAFSLTAGSTPIMAQSAGSREISNLLNQAKEESVLAANDAETLDSYARSRIGWKTHTARLAMMKDHINELGQVNKQLSDLKSQGSPWQQQAISQIDPLLRELAAQLTATIDHLNKNQSKVHFPPYRDYVRATYESASSMRQLIADFIDYDKAQSKARDLEQKLELTTASAD